jgi:transcriptional regulator with XRE-family HTH domain
MWTRQGALLKQSREKKGHNQLQAATAIRLNARPKAATQMISNIERGKQGVPLKSLKLFAVYCEISEWRVAEIVSADYFDRVLARMEGK